MITTYDQALSEKIIHLRNYPNYLPYISSGYGQASQKILIIAESHYLDKKFNDQISSEQWYNDPVSVTKKLNGFLSGMNTRKVIDDYYVARTHKPYRIFLNLESAYSNVFPERLLFKECAFINYFQRPAERNGQSIKTSEADHRHAFENLSVLINTIAPDKIIFTSRKAFDSYKSQVEVIDYNKINVVPHPASAWWNKKSPRYGINNISSTGREKFLRIIRK